MDVKFYIYCCIHNYCKCQILLIPDNFLGETLTAGSESIVHWTIEISESKSADIGVSGTIEGVADLWGVGSSSMTKTVRFGFGFGSGSVRRFLGRSGNGVEGSSSSERTMGSIVTVLYCGVCLVPSSNKRGITLGGCVWSLGYHILIN